MLITDTYLTDFSYNIPFQGQIDEVFIEKLSNTFLYGLPPIKSTFEAYNFALFGKALGSNYFMKPLINWLNDTSNIDELNASHKVYYAFIFKFTF